MRRGIIKYESHYNIVNNIHFIHTLHVEHAR